MRQHHPGPPLVEQSPAPVTAELIELLDQVEYYQPLYGVSGLEDPLRGCRDRALAIADGIAALGGGCRLVDFGSSLGYFPFFFADRGATTTGFDIKPGNTAVAIATGRLNGLGRATFRTASLDLDTVRTIAPGTFDVALVLSVLHHVTHRQGMDYVVELVSELFARIPVLVLELAHRGEDVPYPWRRSLPEDPLAVLAGCHEAQARLLGHFPSHLSTATRPMYLVTRGSSPAQAGGER